MDELVLLGLLYLGLLLASMALVVCMFFLRVGIVDVGVPAINRPGSSCPKTIVIHAYGLSFTILKDHSKLRRGHLAF
jgi:hypothetical protein